MPLSAFIRPCSAWRSAPPLLGFQIMSLNLSATHLEQMEMKWRRIRLMTVCGPRKSLLWLEKLLIGSDGGSDWGRRLNIRSSIPIQGWVLNNELGSWLIICCYLIGGYIYNAVNTGIGYMNEWMTEWFPLHCTLRYIHSRLLTLREPFGIPFSSSSSSCFSLSNKGIFSGNIIACH